MKNPYKAALSISAVLALVAMPAAVRANTIKLTQTSGYNSGNGGEFTAVTGSSQSFLGNGYVGTTLVDGGFQTFCVETGVEFTPGTTYNYTTSAATSVPTTLTEGAAYLYYYFATGTLANYDYTAGTGRTATASELQAAIWYLMGGQLGNGYTMTSIVSDQFYMAALAALGGAASANEANTSFGVEVLNLTIPGTTTAAQNQLVLTGGGTTTPQSVPNSPVPDGGTTVLLLGSALSGLALVKRKLTA